MKVLKKKLLMCIWKRKVVYIGLLRPANLPQVTVEVAEVVDICFKRPATLLQVIAEFVDIGQVLPSTINLVIVEDMFIDVDLGHKRPDTITLLIRKHDLMLKGEVDIGLRLDNITPITKLNMVYC